MALLNAVKQPARDVEIPKQTNDQTRTRQYVRTAAEASQVPDSFINGITQDVMNDVYAYVPISNNEAMNRAVSTVENMGLDKAIEQWNAAVNGDHMPGKYDVALGEYLLTLAGKNNDPALASKMIIELSTVATNAGQAVQAMSMLKRMTPEGQLMALQKVADRINRERPDSNVKIPEAIIDRVQRVNPRDTEAVDQIMHDGLGCHRRAGSVYLAGQMERMAVSCYARQPENPHSEYRRERSFCSNCLHQRFFSGRYRGRGGRRLQSDGRSGDSQNQNSPFRLAVFQKK